MVELWSVSLYIVRLVSCWLGSLPVEALPVTLVGVAEGVATTGPETFRGATAVLEGLAVPVVETDSSKCGKKLTGSSSLSLPSPGGEVVGFTRDLALLALSFSDLMLSCLRLLRE